MQKNDATVAPFSKEATKKTRSSLRAGEQDVEPKSGKTAQPLRGFL